jgi:hypothetical protein
LEKIGDDLGTILATNRIENSVLEAIRRMKTITSQQSVVWKTRVREDNKAYLDMLGEFSHDISATIDEIENETEWMLEVLKKLDQGASRNDVDLIANASYIRINTRYEPVIITDDRDLLTCGHILSSFFGLTLGFLSGFEILRIMGLDDPFIRYCKYYMLNQDMGSIRNTWSRRALEEEISKAMRQAKIACHPNFRHSRGTSALLKMIRR